MQDLGSSCHCILWTWALEPKERMLAFKLFIILISVVLCCFVRSTSKSKLWNSTAAILNGEKCGNHPGSTIWSGNFSSAVNPNAGETFSTLVHISQSSDSSLDVSSSRYRRWLLCARLTFELFLVACGFAVLDIAPRILCCGSSSLEYFSLALGAIPFKVPAGQDTRPFWPGSWNAVFKTLKNGIGFFNPIPVGGHSRP